MNHLRQAPRSHRHPRRWAELVVSECLRLPTAIGLSLAGPTATRAADCDLEPFPSQSHRLGVGILLKDSMMIRLN